MDSEYSSVLIFGESDKWGTYDGGKKYVDTEVFKGPGFGFSHSEVKNLPNNGYNSPLNKINFDDQSAFWVARDGNKHPCTPAFLLQEYNAPMQTLLTELEAVLNNPDQFPNYVNIALHVPRLMWIVNEFLLAYPSSQSRQLFREAIKLGVDVYKGKSDAKVELAKFKADIIALGCQQLLNQVVEQVQDGGSWYATRPELSQASALMIREITKGAPILVIGVARGGVACALDTMLRYADLTSTDSEFYVVQYSVRKRRSLGHGIDQEEIQYLKELSQGRQIVVMDDDSTTGDTIRGVTNLFFSTGIAAGKTVIGKINTGGLTTAGMSYE